MKIIEAYKKLEVAQDKNTVITGVGDDARDYTAEQQQDEMLKEHEKREAEKEEKKQ